MEINWIDQEWLDDKREMKMLSKFIPDNRIVMFAANAANGKTTVVLAQIEEILKNYPNKKIIYGDYDQGIHRANKHMFDRLISDGRLKAAQINNNEEHEAFRKYINSIDDSENTVLVIDGFQGYANKINLSITDNSDMTKAMNTFKALRDNKKMGIILIHHNNKQDAQTKTSVFRGAASIEDSLDCMFYVKGEISNGSLNMEIYAQKFDGVGINKGETIKVKIDSKGILSYEDGTINVDTEYLPKGIDKALAIKAIENNLGTSKTILAGKIQDIHTEYGIAIGMNKCKSTLNTLIEKGLFKTHNIGKNKQVVVSIELPTDTTPNRYVEVHK